MPQLLDRLEFMVVITGQPIRKLINEIFEQDCVAQPLTADPKNFKNLEVSLPLFLFSILEYNYMLTIKWRHLRINGSFARIDWIPARVGK